jgi:peptidoglycan hydrolase-like protein with peptidoglycan-binding domain
VHHQGALRVGSHGAEVQRWQSELNQVDNAGLAEDGVFGHVTEQATIAFQHLHGLTTDGVAGPITQGAMAAVLAHPPGAAAEQVSGLGGDAAYGGYADPAGPDDAGAEVY